MYKKKQPIELDQQINKYDVSISTLKNEIEQLRHQLSVKTHNQHLISNNFLLLFSNNPENTAKDNTSQNKAEKLQKEIFSHFIEENKVIKEIIEDETMIENHNNELKEAKFLISELETNKNKNFEKLKVQTAAVVRLQTQITNLSVKISNKKTALDSLIEKREILVKSIANFLNEPFGDSLNVLYQYQVLLINNLNLDHKKKSNNGILKIKEHQISKLLEQLRIRDEAINLAQEELKKNKMQPLKYDKLKKIEDLKILSVLQLPSIPVNRNFLTNDDGFKNRKI